ncbi:MAG: hypothetical protein PWP37_1819 [Thermotogota bacterium]|uniref:hypothetical protein n=1 Tax=Pseudothermotoga sp. TaxID=2033661 RepID=UPI000E8853F7|nr:hypothetical protein [Pseudothermotoga sp.]MDI3495916.1 hypothetical protein [Pseudothermotoga sp.]MDK2865627.1 hypothetical protein [Thermotogota bacterium]HBJ80453.1 hypothetical protein [Pseudothermotoga sp.]
MKRLIVIKSFLLIAFVTLGFIAINPEELRFISLRLKGTLERTLRFSYDSLDVDSFGNFVAYDRDSDVFYVSSIDNPLTGILYNFSDFRMKKEGFIELAIHENIVMAIEENWYEKKPSVRVFALDLAHMSSKVLYEQELEARGLPVKNIEISPDGQFVGFAVSKVEEKMENGDKRLFHHTSGAMFHLLDLKTGGVKILIELDRVPNDWALGNGGTLLLGFQDGKIKYVKPQVGKAIEKEFEQKPETMGFEGINSLAFLNDHKAAIEDGSGMIYILNLENGRIEAILTDVPSILRLFTVSDNLIGIH